MDSVNDDSLVIIIPGVDGIAWLLKILINLMDLDLLRSVEK